MMEGEINVGNAKPENAMENHFSSKKEVLNEVKPTLTFGVNHAEKQKSKLNYMEPRFLPKTGRDNIQNETFRNNPKITPDKTTIEQGQIRLYENGESKRYTRKKGIGRKAPEGPGRHGKSS
ncbi:hypothetical protein JTB14_003209 [Gonioctena quinquepunctata]|nr:hypothetical protein JTB14_003209 [Gonioctena quinquepunctata]